MRERWMSRAALMTAAMAGWLYLMMVWVSKVGLVRGGELLKNLRVALNQLFYELLRDDHVEDFELGALVQVSVGTTFAA